MGPVQEDLVGIGARAALELGLDGPWHGRARVLVQDEVDAERVDVLGIEKEAVHVKETGPHGRESGNGLARVIHVHERRGHTQFGEPFSQECAEGFCGPERL